jgi:hypothetical protein
VKRRPSFALVVALLALFVALGGPAEAQRLIGKGDVGSREVKDRSLKVRDLSRRAARDLKATANSSITEAKLANRSVTPGKLAPGAVGSEALADNSIATTDLMTGAVNGAKIADGSLAAQDIARFHGRFRIQVPAINPTACWSGEPAGLTPELVGADISQDLVLVTPDSRWPEDRLAFTWRNSSIVSRFVLAGCNRTGQQQPAFEVGFRYVVIDLP